MGMTTVIEIIDVKFATVPTQKGSYQTAEVAYKDLKDGKVNGKKIMDFVDKKVFAAVKNFAPGNKYEIELDKNKDGYWQWMKVMPSDGNVIPMNDVPAKVTAGQGNPTPRSNYETPEERARRQDYIIRQSSLANAITLLKTEKNIPSADEVMALAEKFVVFVYAKPLPDTQDIASLEDDIPY